MALRCRVGDLAIVLRSVGGREGYIVEVLRFVGCPNDPCLQGDDFWTVSWRGRELNEDGLPWIARDSELLPIRPGELKEEMEKEATA